MKALPVMQTLVFLLLAGVVLLAEATEERSPSVNTTLQAVQRVSHTEWLEGTYCRVVLVINSLPIIHIKVLLCHWMGGGGVDKLASEVHLLLYTNLYMLTETYSMT